MDTAGTRPLTTTPLEQETVVPLHSEPDPTPMTLMGLQVRPRSTSRLERLTPMLFRMAVPAAELAYTCPRKYITRDQLPQAIPE